MWTRNVAPAVAGLGAMCLALPALAQSNVTIYGRLNLDFESVRASSGTNDPSLPSRNRISSNSSLLGFKGTENLGNGLSAWFQIESQINVDAGSGNLATRNSGVGLKGAWGNLFLGRWDSPYKVAQVKFDPFGDVTIASEQNILAQTSSLEAGDFHDRIANGVQYWTPEWAGFSARVAYGANENRDATTGVSDHTWAGAVYYEQGPFFAVAAVERHSDRGALGEALGATTDTTGNDTGKQAGFGFKFGATKVGLLFERLEYKTDFAGGSDLRRDAWFLGGSHQLGPVELRAYYAKAGDQKGSSALAGPDTGAEGYSVGLAYDLSKRTELYTTYTRIDNEANAEYEFGINASPGLEIKGRPGSDPSGFLVGMKHVF